MIILIYLIHNWSSRFYYTVMQTNGQITMFPVQPSLWLSAKQRRNNVSKILKKKCCFYLPK